MRIWASWRFRISTRVWLQFLQARGQIESANEVERAAISNGRKFWRLRIPD